MIARIKAWFHHRRMAKALESGSMSLRNVLLATSIEREANEQYSLGSCTCIVMKDKQELRSKLESLSKTNSLFDASKSIKAANAWLKN
jgi:hypothetical protein